MVRRLLIGVIALAGTTCGLNAEVAPASQVAAQPAAKQATLSVQEVTLAKPIRVASGGDQKSVQNLTEFRVTSAGPLPVRALDPVLVVGTTRVSEYRYENRDRTLVFFLYEPATLATDAVMDVYLQYGDDVSSRTTLPKLRRADIRKVRR